MINKLLITYLQRNKRLVIPTLGAFIRKKVDGVGEVLVFVPFLNKDDGELCQAIKSWAGVNQQDAQQILDEYVVTIKSLLKERNQYIIESLGVLKYDTNGIIYLAKEESAIVVNTAPVVAEVPAPIAPAPVVAAVAAPVVTIPIAAPDAAPIVVTPPTVAPVIVVEPVAPAPIVIAPAPVEPVSVVAAMPEVAPVPEQQVLVAPEVNRIVEDAPLIDTSSRPFDASQYQVTSQESPYRHLQQDSQAEQSSPYRHLQQEDQGGYTELSEDNVIKPTSDYTPKSQQGAVSYYDHRSSLEKSPENSVRAAPTIPVAPVEVAAPQTAPRERVVAQDTTPHYFAPPTPVDLQAPVSQPKARYSSIYDDSDLQAPKRDKGVASRRSGEPQRKRRARGSVAPQKSNNVILWVAIAAVIMTIGILVYGSKYGGEQVIDQEDMINQINHTEQAAPKSK